MKRIAIVGNFAHTMLRFRGSLVAELASCGHRVYGFATDYDECSRAQIRSLGGQAVDYRLNSRGLNPVSDVAATLHLARQLHTLDIDAMLACFAKPVIFGAFAARLAGVSRRIGMIEGLGNAFTRHAHGFSRQARLIQQIQAALYRRALPLLDTVVLLNPDDERDLLQHYHIPTRQTVMLGPIGLNLADYPPQPMPEGPVSFVFVGRLLREKGVFEFLQAAQIVKEQYPHIRISLVGDFDHGNPFALAPAQLQPYLDNGAVDYVGHVADVAAQLAIHSVFVLPSYREGFPRSTQEAMAVGRAVITTDVPGCRQTVQPGRNGLLVPPFDPRALAEAMCYCVRNPQQVRQMGAESRTMALAHYDARRTNQILCRLLCPNPPDT